MTGFARTATKWAFSLWLTAALALAPAARAFAECMPDAAPVHQSMSHGDEAPCDTPCKHCEGDDEQQSCKGHCAGVTVSIAPSVNSFVPHLIAARALAHRHIPPLALARPPDTPPPRTLPV